MNSSDVKLPLFLIGRRQTIPMFSMPLRPPRDLRTMWSRLAPRPQLRRDLRSRPCIDFGSHLADCHGRR